MLASIGFGPYILGALLCSLAYLILSRTLFSPLRHIPGPRLAALSSWYEFYFDVIQPGRYAFKIKELHEKHGVFGLLDIL